MSQNNTPSDTEDFWEIQIDGGDPTSGFLEKSYETREEAVKVLKENFAEEIQNPDIEIKLYCGSYCEYYDEEEFVPFWEIQLDDGEGNDDFEDEHFETREEAVQFLKENFAEEIQNPDIEITLHYHKYSSGGDWEVYEEEEEEDEELCKNCDSTYEGKKEPFCIMGHKNCGKGLPHITTLYEEEEEEDFAEEILKRQLMKKRLEEEEDKNWEGRGGGICMRKVINCDP